MKYIVSIRIAVEDWEDQENKWSDEFYSEPYIEADSKEEAEDIARDFIRDCDGDPERYEYLVLEYK
jgi:hypothetical protein